MKKIFTILGAGIFIFLIFVAPNIKDINNWWKERKYDNYIYDKALKNSQFMLYGKDKEADKVIAFMADASNWSFQGQRGLSLIKTGDSNVPYITSTDYMFQDVNDKSHYHLLKMNSIFNTENDEWIPLTSYLYDASNNKLTLIRNKLLWQGDYEIPYFK